MLLCMVLTACGGNQHSAAQPPHLGIASPKLLAQVMDASTATDGTTVWIECATEGMQCRYSGNLLVRYGANGVYAYKTLPGPIECSNAVFGDPLPGIDKSCSFVSDQSPGAPSAANWAVCAVEGGICSVIGTRQVRYGANGHFVYRTITNSVRCHNVVFGDPASEVDKVCSYANDDAPLPVGGWVECAQEDQQCSFSGTQKVRYGGGGNFTYKMLSGPVSCSNEVFGDPNPGVDKSCSVSGAGTPSPKDWEIVDLGTLGGDETTV